MKQYFKHSIFCILCLSLLIVGTKNAFAQGGSCASATTLSPGTVAGSITDNNGVSDPSYGLCNTSDSASPPGTIAACVYGWYTFTAAANTPVFLDLQTTPTASDIDARIELFTSTGACAGLTKVDCDSDGPGTGGAQVTYTSPSTMTYYVRITDYNCNNGTLTYNLTLDNTTIYLDNNINFNLTCGTRYEFYDSGGPGGQAGGNGGGTGVGNVADYLNNENYTITFTAPAGQNVKLSFRNVWTGNTYDGTGGGEYALDLNAGGATSGAGSPGTLADYLTFYDGASSGSPIIAAYTGETVLYPSPGVIASSGTSLTVNFKSSSVFTGAGWEAYVECTPDKNDAPADIIIPCNFSTVGVSDNTFNAGASTNIVANDQWIATYCPQTAGECLVANLDDLNLNFNSDYLYVYNGTSATGSPMAIFTGTSAANLTTLSSLTTFNETNPSGCITFKLIANNSTNDPDWTTVAGWTGEIFCNACDLGDGGGAECSDATVMNTNWYYAGTNIDDTGNHYDATYNPTGTDMNMYSTTAFQDGGCADGPITRLENTIWYRFTTPTEMCEVTNVFELNYVNCQNSQTTNNGIQFSLWDVGPAGSAPASACPVSPGSQWDNTAIGGTPEIPGGTSLLYCQDEIESGSAIDLTALLDPNRDYFIMVDGFTGQHCFWDFYLHVFPNKADITTIGGVTSNFSVCTQEDTPVPINITGIQDDIIVYWDTQLLSSNNAVYTRYNTLPAANDIAIIPFTGSNPNETVNLNVNSELPVNNTCAPITYYIYVIDYYYWTYNQADAATYPIPSTDAACVPFDVIPITIYPKPPVVADGGCSLNVDLNCPAGQDATAITIQYYNTATSTWVTSTDRTDTNPLATTDPINGQTLDWRVFYGDATGTTLAGSAAPVIPVSSYPDCANTIRVTSQNCAICPNLSLNSPASPLSTCSGDAQSDILINVTNPNDGTAISAQGVRFVYNATPGIVGAPSTLATPYSATGRTDLGTAVSIAGGALLTDVLMPTNTTCAVQSYTVYAIAEPTPADANCRPIASIVINVYPQIVATPTIGSCAVNAAIAITGGCPYTTTYTVDYTSGGTDITAPVTGTSFSGATATAGFDAGEIGTVTFTIANSGAPTSCDDLVVTVPFNCPAVGCTAPTITIDNSEAICQPTVATNVNFAYTATTNNPNRYDLTQTIGGMTFTTVTGAVLAAAPSNITIPVPAGTAAGSYVFTLSVYNSTTPTCVALVPLQLTINPTPTATLTNDGPQCVGSTVNLTATGGGTYTWGAGVTAGVGGAATVTTAGTYTVTVTSAAGCSTTATTVVSYNALPVPTA
jgi:hypothetical protein